MKIFINGMKSEEIKEANNFTELLLLLQKRLKDKAGKIIYWDYANGIIIEGITKDNKQISVLIETEEQMKHRLEEEQKVQERL